MAYVVLSVSGPDGMNGSNGRSYAFHSGGFRDGRDGEDATKPTDGIDGGEIDLHLIERDSTTGAWIGFSGQYCKPRHPIADLQETYPCGTDTLFALKARGGDGGHGGNGGDGENGAMGMPGCNATRYSSGTNGGRGGDGGDAGAGTSGADGGNGGNITLRMRDTDAGLLMVFVEAWTPIKYTLDINGGSGGRAGRHGTAGRGGQGGPGGSGCSWTTENYSYDSRGNRTVTYTNHYNPGGLPGPCGNYGRQPVHILYPGCSGAHGNLRFLITNSVTNEVAEYDEIFDIHLHNVTTCSTTGVFEPEAQIHVNTLTIHNRSTMPTPRRNICITINDNKWIYIQNKEHTMLPHLIAPKSSKEVDCSKPFSFFLRKHQVEKPGPPLRATDTLFMTATMTGIERVFPAFDLKGKVINIKYPVEFTRISHMNSMVVGHVAKVLWGVTNTSQVDFGVHSKNGRCIRVRLDKTGGEVSSSSLRFGLKPEQEGVSTIPPVHTLEKAYIFDIPLLKAGQTIQFEATLTLGEAEAFECAEFWLHLELGQISAPSSPKVVHIQSFDVRVTTIYRGFPAEYFPDVLLVTNHRTTRHEYLSWVELLKQRFGLRFFVWDISQMGHFGFMRPIPTLYSSEPTTLMKDLAGKTMIVLDNEFEYGDNALKVTARNFVLKHEWLEAIHENDNRFYVVNPRAGKNECVTILDELIKTPFVKRQNKFTCERVCNFTQYLVTKTSYPPEVTDQNSTSISEDTLTQKSNAAHSDNTVVDNKHNDNTTGLARMIDEVIEVQIRAKLFRKMERRMNNKARKVDKKLKKLRPHIQHLVLYEWHKSKKTLFQNNHDKKTGGRVTIVPSLTTTKRRIIFAAADWNANPANFISIETNLRGVIAGLGIDIQFCLLERIFITGPSNEDNVSDCVNLFLNGSHRILDEKEQQLAKILKQQIVYDVAVELSTICDGIGDNSSLGDEQILEMMENLRRLVWKVESLTGTTNLLSRATQERPLPTIVEENEDASSLPLNHSTESDQAQFNRNTNVIEETSQIFSEFATHDVPDTTAVGDLGDEMETIFYMFPVKHDTPLGKWMMDVLAQLYAFIKCLRAGIHQSILPNRRTAKMQQQSMDLLHRIGDATIIDFADPRSSAELESLHQEQPIAFDNQVLVNKELPTPPEASVILGLNSHNRVTSDSTDGSSPMSIASGLSFASSATRVSSSTFSCDGVSAARSRIPYKQLKSERQKTIKSFKSGVKLQLRNMIQEHYRQWKKDANYSLGGIFDPSRKSLRRIAMETVFSHFELLIDNTLYGRNFQKKKDGQVGGVKNRIVSKPVYKEEKAMEAKRINNMEKMILSFLSFQQYMIQTQIEIA